jgi:hypothetical protein
MAWLLDHLNVTIPEHAEHLERMHKLSTKALTMIKAEIEGRVLTTPHRALVKEAQALGVFAHELTSFSTTRPDLAPLSAFLLECSQHINPQYLLVIDPALFQALFDLSHGKELEHVASELTPVLETLKAMGKVVQAVPVLASPVVVEPPVVVLRRVKSFADEVDADQYGEAFEALL